MGHFSMKIVPLPGSLLGANQQGWEDVCAKFRECAKVAITPIAESKIARAIELARALEGVADAADLIRSLA